MIGIGIILVIVWMLHRIARKSRLETIAAVEASRKAEEAWRRATARVLSLEEYLNGVVDLAGTNRELERSIVTVAIDREARAIKSVEALLRAQGCSDDQVAYVLHEIRGDK